jgi:hypothetical protein
VHPEQLELAPERRVPLARALAELDLAAMVRNLAADHAERLAAPRARPCRCGPRAWGHGRHCCRCGRDLQALDQYLPRADGVDEGAPARLQPPGAWHQLQPEEQLMQTETTPRLEVRHA